MLIGSRLLQKKVTVTITVKKKTLASGQYTESNLLTGLTAMHLPQTATERVDDSGVETILTDVFWFDRASGSLPAIEEDHVLVDGSSNRYEVIGVVSQGGSDDRLKVMAKRARGD